AAIVAAFAAGWWLHRAGIATEDRLPPLHARPRDRPLTWQLLPAAAVAAAAVGACRCWPPGCRGGGCRPPRGGRRAAGRWRWRRRTGRARSPRR
ncbi:hypothetical protein, partial [Actinomadura sp. CNU-125]|uniref:hypothetical protein n=1 Tax=Actinomadura sp. CNU-125 TaxID=1904961 RepID=UPI0021CC7D9F